jgi:5-methylthioadenosine/S-adenosylhomocysteine deaminase
LEHITYCSEAMFRKARDLSDRHGVNIHTHTSEQREEVAVVQSLFGDRPVKKFLDWGILKAGSVLAHCVWLDDAEIAILAATGTGVAHCPTSNMKLASGTAPLAKFKAAGIRVGLGSDGGISNNSLSMWECMKAGSLLQKVTRLDATAVGAEEALRLATIDGARLLGVDEHLGSLEVGKLADVIMIDLWSPHLLPIAESEGHDAVLWNLVFAAQASDVQHVWVGGKPILESRRLTGINEDDALTAIQARIGDLLKRRELIAAVPMV